MPLLFFRSTQFIYANFLLLLFEFYYPPPMPEFNDILTTKKSIRIFPSSSELTGHHALAATRSRYLSNEKRTAFSSSFYTPRLCLLPQSTLRTQTCPDRNAFNRGMHTLKFTLPHKIPHRLPICILLPSSRFTASPFYRVKHNGTRQNNRLAKEFFAKNARLRS